MERAISPVAREAGIFVGTFEEALRDRPDVLRAAIEGGDSLPADDAFGQVARAVATLGLLIHTVFPSQNLALAMISCMAALNACATRTPISTAILLATLTGFQQPVPILFASLTGFFLAPKTPLINAQLAVPGMEED